MEVWTILNMAIFTCLLLVIYTLVEITKNIEHSHPYSITTYQDVLSQVSNVINALHDEGYDATFLSIDVDNKEHKLCGIVVTNADKVPNKVLFENPNVVVLTNVSYRRGRYG